MVWNRIISVAITPKKNPNPTFKKLLNSAASARERARRMNGIRARACVRFRATGWALAAQALARILADVGCVPTYAQTRRACPIAPRIGNPGSPGATTPGTAALPTAVLLFTGSVSGSGAIALIVEFLSKVGPVSLLPRSAHRDNNRTHVCFPCRARAPRVILGL